VSDPDSGEDYHLMQNLDEDYSYEKPGKEVFNPDHTQVRDKPVGIVAKLLDAIGWEQGKEVSFAIGVAIDIALFVLWLILIFTLLDNNTRNSLWYIPILGIVGSIIGVGTPVGGGIVYFPALTVLNVPANEAVAFNYATAVANLGGLGLLTWVRKKPETIVKYFWILTWTIVFGFIGAAMSTYLFPIEQEQTLRIMFLVFVFLVLVYVIYLLYKEFESDKVSEQDKQIQRYGDITMTGFNLFGLAIIGLVGGIVAGWLSVGLDIILFVFLTFFYNLEPVNATILAVLTMGFTSIYPLIIKHIIEEEDVPYKLWLMVEGGSIIGARIGPILISLVGTKTLYFIFGFLLVVEVVRSFVVLVILPATVNVVGDV